MFIAKHTPDGSLLWARLFGNPASGTHAMLSAVTILPSGNILVGGDAHAPIDFGLGPADFTSRGKVMVLVELKPGGTTVAVHLYGDPTHGEGSAEVTALNAAPDGDWVVAGTAFRSIDLGTGPLAHVGFAPFVARYAPNGTARWARYPSAGSRFDASASAVAVGATGEIYSCGRAEPSTTTPSLACRASCADNRFVESAPPPPGARAKLGMQAMGKPPGMIETFESPNLDHEHDVEAHGAGKGVTNAVYIALAVLLVILFLLLMVGLHKPDGG